MRVHKSTLVGLCVAAATTVVWGDAPLPGDEEAQRQAAIAEFTRKTQAANYPVLFDKAAAEFNVPADLLKGIAFAETRWEHLTWPPGETASPETGMPRPFGIMSLWDNEYFGHSLMQAAQLLGEPPERLKQDPLENIRGAAALLRKLYDEGPKPVDNGAGDIESWRYAVRAYCGIPQPELNARHALDIYTFIVQGYHQFGIEWTGRPVNLEPIRQETLRIIADAQAKQQRPEAAATNRPATPVLPITAPKMKAAVKDTGPGAKTVALAAAAEPNSARATWWFIGGAILALTALAALVRKKRN